MNQVRDLEPLSWLDRAILLLVQKKLRPAKFCHPEICLRYITCAPPMDHTMHGIYSVSYSVIAMVCRRIILCVIQGVTNI